MLARVHSGCLCQRRLGGRVGTEHRKVSATAVCFSAQKAELQGPHFFDEQDGPALCKDVHTFLILI